MLTESQLALNMAVLAILIAFGALAKGHKAPPEIEPDEPILKEEQDESEAD